MDKLPDSEIVKAKELIKKLEEAYNAYYDTSKGMPYDIDTTLRETAICLENSLNEINRLQAENERLKGYQKDGFFNLLGNCLVFSKTLKDYNDMRKGLKTEAYKEFAEKSEKEIFIKQEDERKQMLKILKTYRGTRTYSDTEQATDNWLRGYGEAVQDILGVFDNILKELVGDSK